MEPAIVFFDDYCVLCSRSVQFIYRNDRKGRFFFASLDSQAFRKVMHLVEDAAEVTENPAGHPTDSAPGTLPGTDTGTQPNTDSGTQPGTAPGTRPSESPLAEPGAAPGTVILYINGMMYTRSAAALHIISRLRFPVMLLAAGWAVPPFLRNAVYDWIARNRYRWFGKRETCFVPGGGLKSRVLT